MNKQIIIGGLVALVIVGGIAFYGGMAYANMSRGGAGGGDFANLSAEDRARFSANGGPTGMRAVGGMGGGLTAGEVISKDETSITVKMQNGSTKIVLVGSGTQVMKSATGSTDDLAVGVQVTVTGSANSDGSVTAQAVQIRPASTAIFIDGQQKQDQ